MSSLDKSTSWVPTRPISKGALAYHRAVVRASWHVKNISALIAIIKPKIHTGDVIIDYGAGTGASAVYLLRSFGTKCKLLLVDNSASWLAKAYSLLHTRKNVTFALLPKKEDRYLYLDELVGSNSVDHVFSANTVHLIPNLKDTFTGIYKSLKPGGIFIFNSGNIVVKQPEKDVLMIENSINQVHDLAVQIIRTDERFKRYRDGLSDRMRHELGQRRFVFPLPRPISFYLRMLSAVGFINPIVTVASIKVTYADWLKFLRVRRLQAGILPEVNVERDRDRIIVLAAHAFFAGLKKTNHLATRQSFVAVWTYVQAQKLSA